MTTIHDRTPDLVGEAGQAWSLVVPQAGADRLVGGWVIHAPHAHPFWAYYTIEVIHLRDNDGSLMIYDDKATHEFVLWSINPDHTPVLDGPNHVLQSKNFAAQIGAESDAHALTQVKAAVVDVVGGRLSPDTDYIQMWVQRFGESMMRTFGRRL